MFKRLIASFVCLTFIVSTCPPVFAQEFSVSDLPVPGAMVSVSPSFEPALIKGLTVHKDNPFLFDFIVDPGQSQYPREVLKDESMRMIKYFFAALTIPDKDIWVNLSPYEKDRTVPISLGETAMGRDLLAQDYMLKQLTASLIYPQKALGKTFWDTVYAQAKAKYGTTQIPVNTFNKVWIVPQRVGIYEHGQTALIMDGHLKVMLEEDYLSLTKHNAITNNPVIQKDSIIPQNDMHSLGSQIIKQIILPEIEKEVNQGKNFATLRQIFYAQALAVWFKNNLKQALLNRVYANKGTVKGIDQNDAVINEAIYHRYLSAYKKGVFNFVKEDIDPVTQESMPRKYFSGGYAGYGVGRAMVSIQLTKAAANDNAKSTAGYVDFAVLAETDKVQAATLKGNADAAMAGRYFYPNDRDMRRPGMSYDQARQVADRLNRGISYPTYGLGLTTEQKRGVDSLERELRFEDERRAQKDKAMTIILDGPEDSPYLELGSTDKARAFNIFGNHDTYIGTVVVGRDYQGKPRFLSLPAEDSMGPMDYEAVNQRTNGSQPNQWGVIPVADPKSDQGGLFNRRLPLFLEMYPKAISYKNRVGRAFLGDPSNYLFHFSSHAISFETITIKELPLGSVLPKVLEPSGEGRGADAAMINAPETLSSDKIMPNNISARNLDELRRYFSYFVYIFDEHNVPQVSYNARDTILFWVLALEGNINAGSANHMLESLRDLDLSNHSAEAIIRYWGKQGLLKGTPIGEASKITTDRIINYLKTKDIYVDQESGKSIGRGVRISNFANIEQASLGQGLSDHLIHLEVKEHAGVAEFFNGTGLSVQGPRVLEDIIKLGRIGLQQYGFKDSEINLLEGVLKRYGLSLDRAMKSENEGVWRVLNRRRVFWTLVMAPVAAVLVVAGFPVYSNLKLKFFEDRPENTPESIAKSLVALVGVKSGKIEYVLAKTIPEAREQWQDGIAETLQSKRNISRQLADKIAVDVMKFITVIQVGEPKVGEEVIPYGIQFKASDRAMGINAQDLNTALGPLVYFLRDEGVFNHASGSWGIRISNVELLKELGKSTMNDVTMDDVTMDDVKPLIVRSITSKFPGIEVVIPGYILLKYNDYTVLYFDIKDAAMAGKFWINSRLIIRHVTGQELGDLMRTLNGQIEAHSLSYEADITKMTLEMTIKYVTPSQLKILMDKFKDRLEMVSMGYQVMGEGHPHSEATEDAAMTVPFDKWEVGATVQEISTEGRMGEIISITPHNIRVGVQLSQPKSWDKAKGRTQILDFERAGIETKLKYIRGPKRKRDSPPIDGGDKATLTEVFKRGGIDLSGQDAAMRVTKDADGGVKVDVDPALIARVERAGMPEVDPVIIDMQPADMRFLFGVEAAVKTPVISPV